MSDILDSLAAALADRYRIERELGAGGMATVYLAEDLKHHRKVALKVLRPELAAILGAERFVHEITVTANLQHPNILPLYDSGEAGTFLYYVMPYVEGVSLREKLSRERQLAVEEAVGFATAIAGALQYAHEQGIVHRDIKPENILLSRGQPLLADFGIALAISRAGGPRLTETGLSLGTPHYMSPEQAAGDRELDARSDVYSLGAVVYEMLTGEPPHSGKGVQAIVAKILSERPSPISQTRDLVPPNVDAAVQKALAKSPADRFTTAGKFAEALVNPSFTITTATAAPAGPSRRSALIPLLAATTVLATAAALWFALRPVEKPVSRFSLALAEGESLAAVPGHRVAISPDGRRFAYVAQGAATSRIMLRELDQLSATPLPGTEGGQSPSFSPDGQRLAFLTRNPVGTTYYNASLFRVREVSINGSQPTTLADSGILGGGTAWSADDYIYFDAGTALQRIRAGGGPRETVVALDTAANEVGFAWPEPLPNGRGLVYRRRSRGQSRQDYEVMALDLRTGERRPIVRAVVARYAASGHLLYVTADGRLFAAPFDQDRLRLTGPATLVTEGLNVGEEYLTGATDLSVSRNGSVMYTMGGVRLSNALVWRERDGSTRLVDPNWGGYTFFTGVALSPDGRELVFSSRSVATGYRTDDVWVKPLSGGPVSRLTIGDNGQRPVWTADGRSVLFLVPGEHGTVYRKRADGSDVAQVVARGDRPIDQVVATPDGRGLVLHTSDGESDLLFVRLGRDSMPSPLLATRFRESDPAVSPDGRWLAYVSDASGVEEVYVSPFPDVKDVRWQLSVSGGTYPRWAHSGREIFYINGRGELVAAQLQGTPTFSVGRQQTLFAVPGGSVGYDVSVDDQRFVTIEAEGATASTSGLVLVQYLFQELKAKVGR